MLSAVKGGPDSSRTAENRVGKIASSESATAIAKEMLCTNLSDGLHAAAQPLTILRARLFKGNTDRMDLNEMRELAASSAAQVERVCTIFGYLQEFVGLESVRAELSTKPVLPLLTDVIQGLELIFKRDGIELITTAQDSYPPVLIDSARTSQALSIALLIAHSISRAKDSVTVVASQVADAVRVTIQNPSAKAGEMGADKTMQMSLAAANIHSQQGHFSWSPEPFKVEIELQRAPIVH